MSRKWKGKLINHVLLIYLREWNSFCSIIAEIV